MSINKENELFENPEALQEQLSNTTEFVQKNKNIFIYGIGAVAVVIGGFFFWKNYTAKKEVEAAKAIYVAEDYFRKDSFNLALKGDGKNKGFEAVANNFSGTTSGEMANFYMGIIELKNGKFAEAAKHLEEYNTGAFLVQARAYALAGDAYSEQGKVEEAIKYYTKASESEPNKEFTPQYMMKLALAHEDSKQYSEAVLVYEKIISEYPFSDQIDDAKKYLAKAQYIASKKN